MIGREAVETPSGPATRVTFQLPAGMWAHTVHLVGDFNQWNRTSHPLQRTRDGGWALSVDLGREGTYRFRYLVDDSVWLTDGQCDDWPHEGSAPDFMVRVGPTVAERRAAARPRRRAQAARPVVAASQPVGSAVG